MKKQIISIEFPCCNVLYARCSDGIF